MEGHLLFNKAVTKGKNTPPPNTLMSVMGNRNVKQVLYNPVVSKDVFIM